MEEATVTDVNRSTWTCTAETRHTAKTVPDLHVGSPYHNPEGDGFHVMPDVGAICHIAWPSDNTPPWIIDFIGAPSAVHSEGESPIRSTGDAEGSDTDVSFRSRRPRLNPGDMAMTTRDGNHLIVRRGGVLEIGATPISKRIYLPIQNFIKDFCENYAMHSIAGDLEWTVARVENDPDGNAPATWTLHLNEFAQDERATVRVRHLPALAPGESSKSAWEVDVSPQGIDRDTGEVTSSKYHFVITIAGDQIEVIGASREITVEGDDTLTVGGSQSVDVGGDYALASDGKAEIIAQDEAVLAGSRVKLGGRAAASQAVKGDALVQWFGSAQWVVAGTVATLSPASLAQLQGVLSRKVSLE